MQKSIDDFSARVGRDAKGVNDAAIAAIAGHWKGSGMDITIGKDGAVDYTRTQGATTRSFGGKIQKIDDGSFTAGALGIDTTFKVDKRPAKNGPQTTMTVDGAELTRIDPP